MQTCKHTCVRTYYNWPTDLKSQYMYSRYRNSWRFVGVLPQ